MTFDYARSKATADRLIARFGQAAVLRRPTTTGPAYNPASGAPQDYPVIIVVLDYDVSEIDGTRVQATDKKVLMARGSLVIDPLTSDKLVIGGVEHSFVPPLKPLSPGGIVVFYDAQVRK